MHEKNLLLFSEKELKDFCTRSLETSGLSKEDAELTSDTLVKSEMMGVSGHGVVRLPFYCKRLIDKGTKRDPNIKVMVDKPAMLLIDGDNGLGQVIGIRVMQKVVDKARISGICFAGVRNSCHLGMVGYYPLLAAKDEMIGVVGTNAPPVMAAWGGSKPMIGNNPLAVAIPTAREFPLMLDISMSVASGGKVRLAAVKNEKIPLGWILDGKGRPTDRPEDLVPDGTLLPMGHKGFGLAVMIEALTGALSGAGILSQMGIWFRDTTLPINNGHFFMAIDIGAFCDLEIFKRRINQMIDELKSSPLSEDSKGIFMPGEIEFLNEQTCRREGIPVSLEVLKNLNNFASEICVPRLETQERR